MSIQNIALDRQALEQLQSSYLELESVHQITALPESEFIQAYVNAFDGDIQQARRVYQLAQELQQHSALLWANLKDMASPFMQSATFNTIPDSFLNHQASIPGYDRLFGNLDYVDCEPCRSVFGPAAYFVDLMRFIEQMITERNPIPMEHRLDRRRPDLFSLKLDCPNTDELVAYIDLVNEALETIVANPEQPNSDEVIEAATFPSQLPFNLPLEQIRTYLSQLKLNLTEIYQIFETTRPTKTQAIARETLSLSPREFDIIQTEFTTSVDVLQYYGLEGTQTLDSLMSVDTFLQQTGLSREELTELLFQDLTQEEVSQGLARRFFINQAEDGLDYLHIAEDPPAANSFYQVPQERLVNLSLAKLDRIYRFVKLARKLEWSFAGLDRALRSLYPDQLQERVLRFDGNNDAVTVSDVTKLDDLTELTIEAWINPGKAKANPILYKGVNLDAALTDNAPSTHFLFGLDANNRLILVSDRNTLEGSVSLPLNRFSHVAVTITANQVTFYVNGQPERLQVYSVSPGGLSQLIDLGFLQETVDQLSGLEPHAYTRELFLSVLRTRISESELNRNLEDLFTSFRGTIQPFSPVGTTVRLGADCGSTSFAGIIQDVRIWQGVRQDVEINRDRWRRLTGQEPGLVAYWPLLEKVGEGEDAQVRDWAVNPNHGVLGGIGSSTRPAWVPNGLEIGALPLPLDSSYQFNGADQFLAARNVRGFAIDDRTGHELTVEAWVNLAQDQGNTIFRMGSVDGTQPEFECGVTLRRNFAILAGGSFHQATIPVELNQFTHVAVTIHETQVQFYVNGQPAGTGTLPQAITILGTDLEIGRNLSGDHLNGQLREVRVWNIARTAEQIQQTLYRALPIRATGLMGYWRLNQVEAGRALDLSPNQNHLSLGGIPADFMPDRIPVDRLLPVPIATTSSVLELDGANDVIVVNNPENIGLGHYDRFTLELWFKPTNLVERANLRQVIYSQGDTTTGLNAYLFENQLFVLNWCEDDADPVLETVWRSQPLEDQWHHLAITYDTTRSRRFIEFRAYLNGDELTLESSNHPNTANLAAAQNGFLLSRNGITYLGGIGAGGMTRFAGETVEANSLHHFSGQITEVRLWNRIRSASEIQQERFVTPDPEDASLISYLPMTEGQGLVVSDPSSQRTNPSQGALQVPDLVLNGDRIELLNVHSYYDVPEALNWKNYVYTGKLSLTDADGAIGVSFLNRNPDNPNRAYILRRTADRPTFHLATLPRNTQALGDRVDSGVNPTINTDYQFRIEVWVGSNQNTIRAKVWQSGTPEPETWQIEAEDDRDARPTAGTVGIWADDSGSKFFANLQVDRLVLGEDIGISPSQRIEDWQDTAANFSTTPDGALFGILPDRDGFFGTESNGVHIHSHYAVPDALAWTNYSYSGRLQTTDPTGAIGVTFFSRYPDNQTRYYRLRAWGQQFPFALETRADRLDPEDGSVFFKGKVNSNVPLLNNVWYRFLIEVEAASSQTNIRAKVWREDESEPDVWQIDASDDRPNLPNQLGRLKSGTVGVWAANPGAKLYDDLRVFLHTPLLSTTPTAVELSRFQTINAPVPAPWVTTDQYPLLFHPLNQRALRFDGQREYLATALTDDRRLNLSPFTIEAWVQIDRSQPNPVLSWQSAADPAQTTWFGVNGQGQLTISSRTDFDTTEVTGTTVITPGEFTHIAASVNGTTVTFYVNGNEDAQVPAAIALNAAILELGRDGANQYFAGEIQDVRVWKTDRTAEQFASQLRYQQPDAADPDLVTYWSFPEADGVITQDASNQALDLRLGGLEGARQPRLILPVEPSVTANSCPSVLDESTLTQLATIRHLQTRHNLPLDRLTALWFEIPHTGRADGQTLFDRVFNGRGLMGEVWSYTKLPIRWNITGQSRNDRAIRSRLMGALQVSSEDLDRLMQWMNDSAPVTELDSRTLNRLYRLSQIPKVLRLTVQDFLRLLELIHLTQVDTLAKFQQVSDRANWLQQAGIQVSELDFLTSATIRNSIVQPYMEVTIRTLATTLTNQSTEFLATSSSFVSDLINLPQSMQIFDALRFAGILDELGAVSIQYQPPVSLTNLSSLPISSFPSDAGVLQAIQTQVEATLSRMRQEQENAVVERLSELFQVEPEILRIIRDSYNQQTEPVVTPSVFLSWIQQIAAAPDSTPLPAVVTHYLYQLSKGLYVINRFTLTPAEAIALLQNSQQFNVTNVFMPTIDDLQHLMMFTELKTAFNDVNAGLIHVFAQQTESAIATAISDLTTWDAEQLTTLTTYFGNASTANQIPELHRLYRAFTLADTLQVEIEFLIQLANTGNLTFDFYRQQADALLNVVRSRYDDEQWQRVYKPLRDRLATQRRDALLSYALIRQLPENFQGRRDADVLYEYLLLDVQIGSEVDTSRILQGTAALQLYVQRCLLNLEQGVNPATIPLDQWNWMKNYRVWEANRKVFLYPESYIEPELRDTKTPEFEELEQELMQGEINQVNVEKAFASYLNKLTILADLKIVGAYLHQAEGSQDRTLYLVGCTPTAPKTYYYRELVMNDSRWMPWKKIDLALDANFVTPVYAFNRLFLFWVEFTASSRQNRTLYHATIRYSYLDLNNTWISPQTYEEVAGELEETQRSRPEWQRVYALRISSAIPGVAAQRERLLVIYGDTNRDTAIPARTLRNARERESFTLRFLNQASSTNGLDVGLSLRFLGRMTLSLGYMTLALIPVLDQLVDGVADEAAIAGLRTVLNDLFGRPPGVERLNIGENLRAEKQEGNQWFIFKPSEVYEIRREGNFLNVVNASGTFLGRMDDARPNRPAGVLRAALNALIGVEPASGSAHGVLRDALNSLFNRPDGVGPLTLTTNFTVESLAVNERWQLTELDQTLLVVQEGNQLNVYDFSSNVLGGRLRRLFDSPGGIALNPQLPFSFENLGNNRWVITDQGDRRYLIQRQGVDFFVYNFDRSFLYRTRTQDSSSINDFNLARDPSRIQESDLNNNALLRNLPPEATLLDVNGQHGLYVLDTGEEQFLVSPDLDVRTPDRLQFASNAGNSSLSFTVVSAPELQVNNGASPRFRFERLDTSAVRQLSFILFAEGVDGLLSLRSQQTQELNFSNYNFLNSVVFQPLLGNQIRFDGAFGLYYRELFFHIPFFIANQLNANQNFAEAQRWYHYIFNPTAQESGNGSDRYWQFLPFRNLGLESLTDILSNQAALAEYRRDPFDPHAIAQVRINAYQKAIVMKYIDNLLDWGDNLFSQNNRESIGEATQLYVLAFNLLGPRPEGRANRRFEEIGDYNAIRQVFNNNPPDFLTEFSALSVPQNGTILTTFCVTENADFVGFWDRVRDRLFNIRHSLNIDGVFRQLDLFQPALDVRALVQSFASGNRDINSILADISRPVPHYRYGYMLDKAKEMTEIVISLGEKLLSAIQSRDAEQLATLQNTHERTILDLFTTIKQRAIATIQGELDALKTSRQKIDNRKAYLDGLINGGSQGLSLNGGESAELTIRGSIVTLQGIRGTARIVSAIQKTFPGLITGTVGVIPTLSKSLTGDQIAAISDGIAESSDAFADALDQVATLSAKIGEYERRKAEWKQERTTVAFELQEIDQQIEIANIRLDMAGQELAIHDRTIQQNQEIADFYRRKFTNEQLYNWMISRLSGLYFQAYKLAYATAKDAERAFQYEFGDDSTFINFGHWDSLRRGLLAGESLQLDLMRLEKYAIDQDSRYQEIEKVISLRSVLPEALTMLRDNGSCFFNLTERMFDEDYPGHFFRVIKSIAISVQSPALNSNQSLNATLIQLNNRTLLEPDIEGVRYLMDGANQTDAIPDSIRSNWRANQQIAVSRPNRDNGMFGNFDFNFLFDDRYFPFEGTGAISSWELEMPQANQFLTDNNSDILIHLKYTSRSDRGEFRRSVQEELRQ